MPGTKLGTPVTVGLILGQLDGAAETVGFSDSIDDGWQTHWAILMAWMMALQYLWRPYLIGWMAGQRSMDELSGAMSGSWRDLVPLIAG